MTASSVPHDRQRHDDEPTDALTGGPTDGAPDPLVDATAELSGSRAHPGEEPDADTAPTEGGSTQAGSGQTGSEQAGSGQEHPAQATVRPSAPAPALRSQNAPRRGGRHRGPRGVGARSHEGRGSSPRSPRDPAASSSRGAVRGASHPGAGASRAGTQAAAPSADTRSANIHRANRDTGRIEPVRVPDGGGRVAGVGQGTVGGAVPAARRAPGGGDDAEGPGWDPVALAGPSAPGLSVWATAQQVSRVQRRGWYVPESSQHPAKMLPSIAAHAICRYTRPGDLVVDPMCGIGTTLVEAVRRDRQAAGLELEAQWATIAAANLDLARRRGARGRGSVVVGDARSLVQLLPAGLRGQAALVITSPPYGANTHGQVNARSGGKVTKDHWKYAESRRGSSNLAFAGLEQLVEGFAEILRGCAVLLRPGGHVVVTARPWRSGGALVDLPGMVLDAGRAAGLVPVERCVALLARVKGGGLVHRASMFQLTAVRKSRDTGVPYHLVAHEDVLVLKRPLGPTGSTSGPGGPAQGDQGSASGPSNDRPGDGQPENATSAAAGGSVIRR